MDLNSLQINRTAVNIRLDICIANYFADVDKDPVPGNWRFLRKKPARTAADARKRAPDDTVSDDDPPPPRRRARK